MTWLDRFQLSTTQRKGYFALLLILFLVVLIRITILFWPQNPSYIQSTLPQEMELWKEEQRLSLLVPHAFDPNTAADTFIYRCKISDYAKKNWLKFRERGRLFKSPEDLLLIYGLDSTWFFVNKDSIFITPSKKPVDTKKFLFDPNTASGDDLVLLGIPEKIARRMIKYREAGGQFVQPEDILKIYGFPEALFQELKPYVRIKKTIASEVDTNEIDEVEIVLIELNTADSLQLLSIKGIGPVFAHRIIERRNQLGGFVKTEQLLEVYGINQERLNDFRDNLIVDTTQIVTLNINTASFKELLHHPYLNYEQVKSLVGYREKIGPHKHINDLLNLTGFKNDDVERLRPYLTVE